MHVISVLHCLTLRLVVAIVLYFIIGAVVMYNAKGARGVEMIPNYTFWKDLPFLIKVGKHTHTYLFPSVCVQPFSLQ